ncbi:inositol monophosphatase family protein [Elioraea sp. Yellowstone]|jgi:histidinol phosphatase-like enzyme (inositol monophosphatase family)|uniref:inositol monophosphatase family protein n=1 Tax=Elioraea sp. Yellowstone TaxID=2592070 RepID=UPI0011501CE7|nr:inositol monophosphatase family protein [Elioraea sp. Yellowstone]TQF78340.1 inositol monophosphatase family protein [Elioraea sp. Yellowstone]
MSALDLDAALAAAEAAADAAAAAIRPWFRARLAIERKDDASPVTAADRAAEQAMRAVLAAAFPDHGILGEEFGHDRPEAPLQWVLDPIDGTKSFVTGRPTYGSLIALLEEGTPVLGVMSQPSIGERWIGLRGRPTLFFSPLGGPAVARCRPCTALAEAQLSVTTLDLFTPDTRPRWERLAARAAQVTWGGDCYAHGLLALGLIDLVAETTYRIWDWAALVPIIEGAGGVITDWSGRALRPGADGSVLAAGDPALHAAARAILNEQ